MELKINFVDFWPGFDSHHNIFVDILTKKYDVVISAQPDYLVYSIFGYENLNYEDCVKIFYVGENITPDFNLCDYAIGFDLMDFGDRYMRLPYYVFSGIESLAHPKIIVPEVVLNRKFCSFVVSNASGAAPERERFFHLLSEYKPVDSGGRFKNNVGGPVVDKNKFVSNYKFNIAFENSMRDGYTTEKIMEPMIVNSLPIYWGNKQVGLDFNLGSFIDASDYPSLEALVERVIQLDTNDEEYLSILSKPWLNPDNYLDWRERILAFFVGIIDKPKEEQRYLGPYGYGSNYRKRLRFMVSAYKGRVKLKKLFRPRHWFK